MARMARVEVPIFKYGKWEKGVGELVKEPSLDSKPTNNISKQLAKEIDLEIDALEMDNNIQIREFFIASAEQLKGLLVNESIKKTPDVVMFNKGYVGLVWETKNDESVFVYSIPDGTLFFNKVGVNLSETRIIDANKKLFSDLIKKINAMV